MQFKMVTIRSAFAMKKSAGRCDQANWIHQWLYGWWENTWTVYCCTLEVKGKYTFISQHEETICRHIKAKERKKKTMKCNKIDVIFDRRIKKEKNHNTKDEKNIYNQYY